MESRQHPYSTTMSNLKSIKSNVSKYTFKIPDINWEEDNLAIFDKEKLTTDPNTHTTSQNHKVKSSIYKNDEKEAISTDSEDILPSVDYQFGNKHNLSEEMSLGDFPKKMHYFKPELIAEEDSRSVSVDHPSKRSHHSGYKTFKRHKSMKAKLFAYVRFNSLRRRHRL